MRRDTINKNGGNPHKNDGRDLYVVFQSLQKTSDGYAYRRLGRALFVRVFPGGIRGKSQARRRESGDALLSIPRGTVLLSYQERRDAPSLPRKRGHDAPHRAALPRGWYQDRRLLQPYTEIVPIT